MVTPIAWTFRLKQLSLAHQISSIESTELKRLATHSTLKKSAHGKNEKQMNVNKIKISHDINAGKHPFKEHKCREQLRLGSARNTKYKTRN